MAAETKTTLSLEKLNELGLRIITLGMSPKVYLGPTGLRHGLLYGAVGVTALGTGIYEFFGIIFLRSGELLDTMSHMYVMICYFTFFYQWVYLLMSYRVYHENGLDVKNSYSFVKVVRGDGILTRNLDMFYKGFVLYCILVGFSTAVYIVGVGVDVYLALITYGRVEEIFVLTYYPIPLWAQWVTSVWGVVCLLMAYALMTATYLVTGLLAVKVETQCEVLREALLLTKKAELRSDMQKYIRDHYQLIKHAKLFLKTCQTLNNPMFFNVYMMMAIQLFVLSITEPTGAYYFSITFDVMNCFVILFSQCWFSSKVTDSLASVASGVYGSPWYEGTDCSAELILMMQMSQRPYVQSLWLGSLLVERRTILQMIQSSYSFYTILLILQEKK